MIVFSSRERECGKSQIMKGWASRLLVSAGDSVRTMFLGDIVVLQEWYQNIHLEQVHAPGAQVQLVQVHPALPQPPILNEVGIDWWGLEERSWSCLCDC